MGFYTLVYHEIREDITEGLKINVADGTEDFLPAPLYVKSCDFEAQLTWLVESGFTFLTLENVFDFYYGDYICPDRSVLLTFDDAFQSLLECVPILEKFNIPAVLFVVSGWIHTESKDFDPSTSRTISFQDLNNIHDYFVFGNHTHQGHGRMHGRSLSQDMNVESLQRDLDLCGAFVDEPTAFAYPFGFYDDTYIENLKACGIEIAFSTEMGINFKKDDPIRLKRWLVPGGTSIEVFKRYFEECL